ncbi:hypothetical protein MHK_005482 [Candidatus Magnetomorum sp. HK-1]|nr:hypothetical protein MHK_005482 [Candidatus Magnetomorum sp. HK-1]
MSAVIAFDTYAYVKKLCNANLPEAQASAHAEALKGLIETNLASKDDIKKLSKDISLELSDFKLEVNNELSKIRQEMSDFKQDVNQSLVEIRQEMSDFKQDINQSLAEFRQEMSDFKQDVNQSLAEFRQEISDLKQDVNQSLAKMETRILQSQNTMIKWVVALFIASTSINIALMKLL